MSELTLSVPSKTFLAGEYLALVGGPALLLATQPKFLLNVKSAEGGTNPFHQNSPAGLFYQKHQSYFSQFDLKFSDPYEGIGGFGASSAQFVLLHGLWQLRESKSFESQHHFDWHSMLTDYRSFHTGEGFPPSGADVVAQALGGLTFFQRRTGHVQSFAWPFDNEILLFHTGHKVSTHEHLKNLQNIPEDEMTEFVLTLQTALQTVDFKKFVQALDGFAKALETQGWALKRTLDIVAKLRETEGVHTAKGCGALGADVVMVIVDSVHKEKIIRNAHELGLRFISGSSQISSGFQIQDQSRLAKEGASL